MHKLVYSTGGIRIEHLCTSVAAALPRGELLDAPGKKKRSKQSIRQNRVCALSRGTREAQRKRAYKLKVEWVLPL